MKNCITSFLAVLLLTIDLFGQSKVTFILTGIPEDSLKNVGIRGNTLPLDWDSSIPLKGKNGAYTTTVDFPKVDNKVEFKFVRYANDNYPTWETNQNRTISLTPNSNDTSNNVWNQEQIIDISALSPLSSKNLLKDFQLIKTMVLNVHPGTYRYNNEEQIAEGLENLESKFSQSLTHAEAYLAISRLTAQLKCDHTKAGFNNQSRVINSIIHYQKDKVPFTFRWNDGKMIVTHNASESEKLKIGTAILSINGVSVEDIKNEMLLYVGADGATDGNRIYKTEVNGYDFRYNAFDIFFPLLYPLDKDTINLDIQEYGTSNISEIEVATLTREDRAKILVERYRDFPRTRDDLWQFEILNDSVGVLTINSFGLFGWKAMTLDYKQFLAETFDQLATKSIKHLIIDIRENTGGADEMAKELFAYLTDKTYNFEREGRTRYLEFPETLKAYVQTWGDDPWYYNLEPENVEPTDGYYIFKESIKPGLSSDKAIFPGKVYLLISSANTSLAFYTAHRFKQQQLGLMIGQETGGNLNDINGGQILFLRLPNSRIEIDFPVMGGFATDAQPNTGVQPDIEVLTDRKDVLYDRDVEIETVLDIIKNNGTQPKLNRK